MFGLDYDSIGDFGEIFTQFYHQPKEAIKFLKRVQCGECIGALYRDDIGDIDLVWGEVTDPIRHEGYGLTHIIDKHGAEIKALGFEVEDFIPIIVQFGNAIPMPKRNRIAFESKTFRFIVATHWNGIEKRLLLTAFDLTKKPSRISGWQM